MTSSEIDRCHEEVLSAFADIAAATGISEARGEQVRADRNSELSYIGLRTPDRRKRVRAGFSFTSDAEISPLPIWDGIWQLSNNGDVLFAALDAYREPGPHSSDPAFWTTIRGWIDRIDNWAHADDLARVYSFALEAQRDAVYPTLEAWSLDQCPWHRRVSIVSLIHYSGKNAVFMPAEPVLKLVANCVPDTRESVYKAVGWVLRETMAAYPEEVTDFLHHHSTELHSHAIRRATERLPADERNELRAALR